METSSLDQGITLMLVGMGTVFAFLTILVLGIVLMSWIAMRFAPLQSAGVSDEAVAAITAALVQHTHNTDT